MQRYLDTFGHTDDFVGQNSLVAYSAGGPGAAGGHGAAGGTGAQVADDTDASWVLMNGLKSFQKFAGINVTGEDLQLLQGL